MSPFKASNDPLLIGSLADVWDGLDNNSKSVVYLVDPELVKWLDVFSSLAFQGRISVDIDCAFCGNKTTECECPQPL